VKITNETIQEITLDNFWQIGLLISERKITNLQ